MSRGNWGSDSSRRDGGRSVPLVNDEWKTGHKSRSPKPFGVKFFYWSLWRTWGSKERKECSWTRWYHNEKAREQGISAAYKDTILKVTHHELLTR